MIITPTGGAVPAPAGPVHAPLPPAATHVAPPAPLSAAQRSLTNATGNPFTPGTPQFANYQRVVGGEMALTHSNNTVEAGHVPSHFAALPAMPALNLAGLSGHLPPAAAAAVALPAGARVAPVTHTTITPGVTTNNIDDAIRAALEGGMASGRVDGESLLRSIMDNIESGKFTSTSPGSVRSVTTPGSLASPAPVNSGQRIGDVTMGDLAEIGRAHGWGPNELAAWMRVIGMESNGTISDTNPSSGAYGIAQMLGSGGHASDLAKYQQYGGDPNTVTGQLTAMANYIAQRYGSPQHALSFHLTNNWY